MQPDSDVIKYPPSIRLPCMVKAESVIEVLYYLYLIHICIVALHIYRNTIYTYTNTLYLYKKSEQYKRD